MAALRCSSCGVPEIAPCESYQAAISPKMCKPIFEAGYEVCLGDSAA
jgi:hypothetical protein